jgi:hypothetical protein
MACINPNSPEFKAALERTGGNPLLAEIEVDGGVKPGVQSVFDSNPELASIGTPQQYSAYLDSIFPDSKVKDIVYHGTDSTFNLKDQLSFWTNTYESAYYGARVKTKYSGKSEIVVSAILDINNPLMSENSKVNYKVGIDFKNNDSIITKNEVDLTWGGFKHSQLIVNSKKQIHILGNKQDIEGFKDFVCFLICEY